jgi:hypothetical protein
VLTIAEAAELIGDEGTEGAAGAAIVEDGVVAALAAMLDACDGLFGFGSLSFGAAGPGALEGGNGTNPGGRSMVVWVGDRISRWRVRDM